MSVFVFLFFLDLFSSHLLKAYPTTNELVSEELLPSEGVADVGGAIPTVGTVLFEGPVRAKGRVSVFTGSSRFGSVPCPRINAPRLFVPPLLIPYMGFLPSVSIPTYPIPSLKLKPITKRKKNPIKNSAKGVIEANDLTNLDSFTALRDKILAYIDEVDAIVSRSLNNLEPQISALELPKPIVGTDISICAFTDLEPASTIILDSVIPDSELFQPIVELVAEPIELAVTMSCDGVMTEVPIKLDHSCDTLQESKIHDTNFEEVLPITGTAKFSGLVPASGRIKIFRTF